MPPLMRRYLMSNVQNVLQKLGLAKNEAQIYHLLLQRGEQNVSQLSERSSIHRRNVYDSLRRLSQRGLVIEIQEKRESFFQAVDPENLQDIINEKNSALSTVMPEMTKLFRRTPPQQATLIYRGIEGWKNCMRDIIRIGEDYYCIAGKGGWMDSRLTGFFPNFIRDLNAAKIKCHVLFDYEVKKNEHPITQHVGDNYRFLPKDCLSTASVEIFGDRVCLVTNIHYGGLEDEFYFTVIANQELADGFKSWFSVMWKSCVK